MRRVPFQDLAAHHAPLEAELREAFARVVASGRFVLGEEVERFEASAARRLGVSEAIAVSSGSDALVCALLALGVGPGDEVVTTPFTFVATAEAIVRVGARPRFVDVRGDTLALDERLIEISARTKAIVPVHLFGAPARIAAGGVPIIEDVAQAFGLRPAGALACFSFFPAKVLGALGDAGLVATDDAELAARCRALRVHGAGGAQIGGNFRMDALQAALLSVKLPHVDAWIARRRQIAEGYSRELEATPVRLPPNHPEAVWACYTLRVPDGARDRLRQHLLDRGIETAVYYARPVHLLPAYARFAEPGALPESERAAREVLSLPIYPELSEADQAHVVASIRAFFAG
jgi:dTDP-4-amino-4,6-dideoxygalactose transaminase